LNPNFRCEIDQAELSPRIITSLVDAKALLEILRESIDQYEKKFGIITDEDENRTMHKRNQK
jgi:hypothetical protein